MEYNLTRDGVFRTIQGEGFLIGTPMTFITFGGCSVGCKGCDVNYATNRKVEIGEILDEVRKVSSDYDWIWFSGGEPTDQPIEPLVCELKAAGYRIALATSGHRRLSATIPLDFVSVSPHVPEKWIVKEGSELKIVPRLYDFGITLESFRTFLEDIRFDHLYVSPCRHLGRTIQECIDWVSENRSWKMTTQAQYAWGIE